MKNRYIWRFPEIINLFEVPEYLQMFVRIKKHKEIVFDMTDTFEVNSSFIGFLIYTKEQMKRHGVKYAFILSPHVVKIITMLGMEEYFSA